MYFLQTDATQFVQSGVTSSFHVHADWKQTPDWPVTEMISTD